MFFDDSTFCNPSSPFWNSSLTWNSTDPEFTNCFERTALVFTPCLVLWLFSPLELYYIRTSKRRDIPWGVLNTTKLVLNIVLICISGATLIHAVYRSFNDSTKIYLVEIFAPVFQIITFILALLFLLWNKLRGIHTSCSLFVFFFFLSIASIPEFRTEIRAEINGDLEDDKEMFHFVSYMIYFPVVVLLFILNFFADKEPRVLNYCKSKSTCPEVNASFFSRATFRWFDPLVWKGFHQPLTLDSLFDLRYQDSSSYIVPKWEKQWEKHKSQEYQKKVNTESGFFKSYGTMDKSKNTVKKPISIVLPLLKTFWRHFLMGGFLKIVSDLALFINPFILSSMISFVSDHNEPMWRGFLYAATMFIAGESYTLFYHNNLMIHTELGINIRTALTSTIFKKALRISSSARRHLTIGEIVNLMAVDSQRFIEFAAYFNLIYSGPIVITLATVFLWEILGPSALAGLGVMAVIVPINITVGHFIKSLQVEQMKYKDERIKLISEVLSGMKVLKLYAWEPSFEEQILSIRNKEIKVLRKAALINASTNFVSLCSSYLVALATFGVYIMVDGRNVLTAQKAFVAIALFNIVQTPIAMFPQATRILIQTIVSTRRINRYLNAQELDLNSVSHDEDRKEPLIIENGTFAWGAEATESPVLQKINMKVRPGSLVAVVGAVGSGKSSLISAFLGEMDKVSGYINTKGRLAYVPQEAWILNDTIKNNILFGSPFDEKKYLRTVEACALLPDFEMLSCGDKTEIGEKGINLSGGQKQRISLARAVYSDCDTYLFDDPLSAVDSHVGKHIYENVIGSSGILNNKTRLLVTHGVVFLPKVDFIFVLKRGQITEAGTFKNLLSKKGEFAEFLVEHVADTLDEEFESEIEETLDENPELHVEIFRRITLSRTNSESRRSRKSSSVSSIPYEELTTDKPTINRDQLTVPGDQLIVKETAQTGKVKWNVYKAYFKAVGTVLTCCTVGFQVLSQAFSILCNVWLSTLTEDMSFTNVTGPISISQRNNYIEVYAALGVGLLTTNWMSSFALAYGTLYAAKGMHMSMLVRILRAPMSFFDTTPSGRIINRFSKDIDIIDNTLPQNLNTFLINFALVGGTIIVITCSTPIFGAIIIPIGITYYFVQRFYIETSRQIKRLESVTRSPVYSHFSETISGASSVRAYKAEERFVLTSERRVDLNTMCWYPSQVSNRWLGIRLETIGNSLVFFAALFSVLSRDKLDAGIVGLSISYALQITSVLNYGVRMTSEVETNIVAVERIKEYTKVPQEAAWAVEPRPTLGWPHIGTVKFDNYQVRYREGLDLVLKGISFTVNGGEKIGIVGRTGAGKSSLTLALFRIIEAAGGHIYIDNVDISKIGLGDLRSKLTIIPQDPVLFSGSLRMNLDPFGIYNDPEIWRVLELSHLSDFARSLNNGLDHEIAEGGGNLSVGQRQLVCLARALLRKTKVLILDEATAAIDLETDNLIQETIRKEFRDCTVLTIAHRLNTIMDSDRVLVLDHGVMKEFASPPSLLKDPNTIFYGMAKDAGLV